MSAELMGPMRAQVLRLLAADGLDAALASDLADKIVEYERNLAHQRDRFEKVYIAKIYEPEARELRMLDQTPERDMLRELIEHQRYVLGRVSPRDLAFVSRQALRLRRSWLAWSQRDERRMRVGAVRYMKRSTNQLIRALRAL